MAASRKSTVLYVALLGAAFAAAVSASWFLGGQIDRAAYDFLLSFRKPKPWKTQSVILPSTRRRSGAAAASPDCASHWPRDSG
jgi:hypothetical protein